MKDKYESEMLQVIHESMKGLHRLGIVSDTEMRKFDKDCIVPEPKKPRKTASSKNTSGGTKPAVRISAQGSGS